MELNSVRICEENTILSGMEKCPPHLQATRMATAEVTSNSGEVSEMAVGDGGGVMVAAAANSAVVVTEVATDGADAGMGKAANLNNSTGSGGRVTEDGIQKTKRKHRRGKPKAKNSKPYRKSNWKFQKPRYSRTTSGPAGTCGGPNGARNKLVRSRSLVPYNTNKFLMEEHLAEVPNARLNTPSGRTRDSSFSIDSEDNYFYSLPEDEEEFLTKEFSNVYERARVERLENLSKQQLIEECLQIEDRFSAQNIGSQKQQILNVQKITSDFLAKIRYLEEKLRDANRDNLELRRKLESITNHTERMCSSSEDSESDSSSSSSDSDSSSCSPYSASSPVRDIESDNVAIDQPPVLNGSVNGYHSPPMSPGESNRSSSPMNGNMDHEEQQSLLDN